MQSKMKLSNHLDKYSWARIDKGTYLFMTIQEIVLRTILFCWEESIAFLVLYILKIV
jgi:hypothetical protein